MKHKPRTARRRKTYDPQKQKRLRLRRWAESCYLYRWLNDASDFDEFQAAAPKEVPAPSAVMQWAMARSNTWLCEITACFMTGEGDYYEEVVYLPPQGPLILGKDATQLDDIIKVAVTEAQIAGNPKHLIDAYVTLRIATEEVAQTQTSDDHLKVQSAYRLDLFTSPQDHRKAPPLTV